MKVKLEDVCEKGTSNLKLSDVVGKNGDYPIYGASGYIGNVNFYKQESPYVAVVKDGAGIGRAILCPAKSSVIGTMQYLIPKANILPEYLYYVVTNLHLEKYFSGATIPHIYFRDYKNETFNLHSITEQNKIVSILNHVEIMIESRNKEINLLNDLIKSRFVEMFSSVSNTAKLKDICSIITDGTHQPPKFVSTGIPFIFVSNIINNTIDLSTDKYIDEPTYQILIKRTPIEIGDLILSTVGSYGHSAVVKTKDRFLFQRHIAYLKPIHKYVVSEYLHSAILSDFVQRQIDRQVKGIAQKTLNLTVIKELTIPIPPLNDQSKFVEFKEQVDKSKLAVQKSLDELEILKKSLMQKYFG